MISFDLLGLNEIQNNICFDKSYFDLENELNEVKIKYSNFEEELTEIKHSNYMNSFYTFAHLKRRINDEKINKNAKI